MKRLGVLDTMPAAEFAIARQHELADVVSISRHIVIAKQR
jgi:hypothetical protein